jgi:hypothetical protein
MNGNNFVTCGIKSTLGCAANGFPITTKLCSHHHRAHEGIFNIPKRNPPPSLPPEHPLAIMVTSESPTESSCTAVMIGSPPGLPALLPCVLRWGLTNFLPRLTSDQDPLIFAFQVAGILRVNPAGQAPPNTLGFYFLGGF